MSQQTHQCQFDETCSTGSSHYRKVISHIFGRNKKCTVNIPDSVWIYHCRKHYQRARYRNDEWPFTQCRLAIDTISNMRAWGGVESFDLTLRRREEQRGPGEPQGDEPDRQQDSNSSSTPTAASAGPQEGLQAASATSPSPSRPAAPGFAAINHHQPSNLGGLAKPGNDNDDDEETGSEVKADNAPATAGDGPEASTSTTTTATAAATAASAPTKKRSPKSIPRPVPDWLYGCVGTKKSFDEILTVLEDLRKYFFGLTSKGNPAFFPDIEILPNLRRQSPTKPQQQAAKKGAGSRVSSRGAVTKVERK
ncbi:uncharacterized protein GIQ15_06978 [Arthroderma uncinatum]|uniref:uncharacterized protein n=1 Tax=Arthroderma uncinatum TaxID=74035 RepID=UPI00144A5201|nr:uncharacterized protein GIQ15_06978 [Arthroderma uncinatum]KAF3480002.1 hypothetical protein GIQ15_06978 [Arthroderma uncinatum]